MVKKSTEPYENNPFSIGLQGLNLFFARAQSVAIYAIVLSCVAFLFNIVTNVFDFINSLNMSEQELRASQKADAQAFQQAFSGPSGEWIVGGLIIASFIFFFILVYFWLYGVLEYTGARLAKGETVGLKQAFGEVGKLLASYLWLNLLIGMRLFLWTLLLIVPGIIMAVRYMLAGTVFFAEGKRGNAAIKRSAELTKGAWFTTFAGYSLWNLMTLTQITALIMPGTSAVLYRQLAAKTDANEAKPPAHWLSWLTFFAPIGLIVLMIIAAIVIFAIVASVTTAP